MTTTRRAFLLGFGTALAAPAIVRADSLMKLWVPPAPKIIWHRQPPAIERAMLLGWTYEQILSNKPVPFLPPAMFDHHGGYVL